MYNTCILVRNTQSGVSFHVDDKAKRVAIDNGAANPAYYYGFMTPWYQTIYFGDALSLSLRCPLSSSILSSLQLKFAFSSNGF